MRFMTIDGEPLNMVPPATRYTLNFDQLHSGMVPVATCEGCGRPLYVPYVDVDGARCHWCDPASIAWREPAKEWH